MKTELLRKNLLLVFCLLAMYSLYGQQIMPVNFAEETNLDLSANMFSGDSAEVLQNNFLDRFRLRDGQQIDPIAEEVVMMDLKNTIYHEAESARKANTGTCANQNCITGVSITLGMDGRKIVAFFRAVYLIKTDTGNVNGKAVFFFDPVNAGPTYRYTNTGFVQAAPDRLRSDYEKNIRIRRFKYLNGDGDFFRNDGTWRADTRDVIYSFQEIFRFYEKVFQNETDANRYTGTLAFHNAAPLFRKIPVNVLRRRRFKHSLFITQHSWDPDRKSALYDMKVLLNSIEAADFAHLCPPACSDLAYKRAQ